MGRHPKLIASILAGIILLTGLGVLAYIFLLAPETAAEKPVPRTLNVFLTKPLAGSLGEVGKSIPVSAEAVSTAPILSIELYADGVLVGRTNAPSPDTKQLNGLWEWTPEDEGEHLLTARALDGKGQAVNSNFIRLKIGPAKPPAGRALLASEGETLALISQTLDIPLPDLQGVNPDINPETPLSGGQPVNLPVPMGGSAPPPGQEPVEPTTPDPEPPLLNPEPEGPPSAPSITGDVVGCTANLKIKPADTSAFGYRLYAVSPMALEPELLESFGPLESVHNFHTFTHSNLFGVYSYFAEAFSDKGLAQSLPISLTIDEEQCSAYAKKAANVKLITGFGLDEAYCYVTNVDSNVHIRMPLADGTFIPPMDPADLKAWGTEWLPGLQLSARTGYDLSPYLPALQLNITSVSNLQFECWGWASGKLHDLGKAEKKFASSDLERVVVIEGEDYQVVGVFGGAYTSTGDETIVLPQPVNLRTTGNPEECAKHDPTSYSLANCQQSIESGMAAFLWDVVPASCPSGSKYTCTPVNDIEGFRIYRQTTPNPQYVYGILGGMNVTNGFVPWPQFLECANMDPASKKVCLNTHPACYTVRAYKGVLQSADSNVVCLGDKDKTTGAKTIILVPSLMGVTHMQTFNGIDQVGPIGFPSGLTDDGEIYAGYHNFDYGDVSDYDDYWGQFMFDLDEVMGKPITSARLTFSKIATNHKVANIPGKGFNCVRSLGVSKLEFFKPGYKQTSYFPQTVLYKPLPDVETGGLEYDVTDAVKAWTQGTMVNSGFVLDGRDPTWPATNWQHVCMNYFNNFKLEITYFPNE
jgi:hypothetical protein